MNDFKDIDYRASYNELGKVVAKIERTSVSFSINYSHNTGHRCQVVIDAEIETSSKERKSKQTTTIDDNSLSFKKALWVACVDFIQFKNSV